MIHYANNASYNYLKRYLNNIIYYHARDEGCRVTFIETEELLSGHKVENMSLNSQSVILNLKRGWEYLIRDLDIPLTLKDIITLNGIISDDSNIQKFSLRTTNVFVNGLNGYKHTPLIPQSKEVTDKLIQISHINNPILQALELFAYITKSQIFNNCNKRTSFLSASKILIENDIGILTVPLDEKKSIEYKSKLVEYYEDELNKDKLFYYLLENCLQSQELDNQLGFKRRNYLSVLKCIDYDQYKVTVKSFINDVKSELYFLDDKDIEFLLICKWYCYENVRENLEEVCVMLKLDYQNKTSEVIEVLKQFNDFEKNENLQVFDFIRIKKD